MDIGAAIGANLHRDKGDLEASCQTIFVGIGEKYFAAARDVHRLGAGTKEGPFHPALAEVSPGKN